ncbi:uncharacterized protein LOC136073450 [Hydra vulgaris]|uniref:uncharacterized protein LOC136073450 n=1 Tax=Hydra vulgaris TaxID=6087 RepID=UPI0032EA776B
MADLKQSVCAVCLEKKGEYSKLLSKVQPSIANTIKEYIWPECNEEFTVCPDVICSNCRRNIFLQEKGSSTYFSNWMSKASQVDRPKIRRSTELCDIIQSSHVKTQAVGHLKDNICSCCFSLLEKGLRIKIKLLDK